MKSYEVHILMQVGNKEEWRPISPTGKHSEPYRFITANAAEWHLIHGYGYLDTSGRIIRKVVESDKPSNISLT